MQRLSSRLISIVEWRHSRFSLDRTDRATVRGQAAGTALSYFPSGILEHYIGEYGRVGRYWQMRTKANTDIEGTVEMQRRCRANLVHRFSVHADEKLEGVAVFLDAETDRHRTGSRNTALDATRLLDVGVLLGPKCEMN